LAKKTVAQGKRLLSLIVMAYRQHPSVLINKLEAENFPVLIREGTKQSLKMKQQEHEVSQRSENRA